MSDRFAVSERQVSPARVVVVALGLIPLGAVAGALAAVLGVIFWLSVLQGVSAAMDLAVWSVAGMVGAALGAVLLPIAGFTLLRYVPLGRALAETIIATALGGAVGMQLLGGWWLVGPLAGFGLATLRLWGLARRPRIQRSA